MSKFTWGRKKSKACSESEANASSKGIGTVLILGVLICLGTMFTFSEKEQKYVPVSSMVDEELSAENENTTADPFGYFNGKWNLWEYLGDIFSSMIE